MHHPVDRGITAVPGVQVGHASDPVGLTGCTVVLCPEGAVGGVDQRGGAPGTRETDLLRPMHLVQEVHAVLLAGFRQDVENRRPTQWEESQLHLEDDETLVERLRGLGYID